MTVVSSQQAGGARPRIELTVRALLIGIPLALLFTGANIYLGLKVGFTFASAIPAAVISMAILRGFRTSTIWENMTVQTVASVGGAMGSIIFALPALVMIGWWTGFPFWTSFFICALGGVLGVTFSIPLRRALVLNGNLPYPEGLAAAEVLKVGSRGTGEAEQDALAVRENKAGLLVVTAGAVASAAVAFLAAARVFAAEAAVFFRLPSVLGGGVTGFGGSISMALLGAGHLIGLGVGLAQLAGLVIAWGIAVPVLSALQSQAGGAEAVATDIWLHQVRFIGAGAIGVAAIWTLVRLIRPLIGGLASALAAQARRKANLALDRTEQDIPISLIGLLSLAVLAGIAILLWQFTRGTQLAAAAPLLVAAGVLYVLVAGFFVAAVCGYMAGLIGTSNSPISGVGILAVITASLLLPLVAATAGLVVDTSIIAFVLVVTAVVIAISVIANDNLQDLKTGQLVEATPWRQQVALIVGALAGSLVIPPILGLLNSAYGFVGGPAATVAGTAPLPAPQATLISSLAQGIINGSLPWHLLAIGAATGAAIVAIDETLKHTTRRWRLAPLAVTLGIYLPFTSVSTIVAGSVAGWLYDRWVAETRFAATARRLGVLLASGLIVGESLFGVLAAGVIVSTGSGAPFALLPEGHEGLTMALGAAVLVAVLAGLYRWTRARAIAVAG